MWLEEVRRRERGELRVRRFKALARSRRAASLALSNRKEIATPHHGAVNSLQVPFFPHLALPPIARSPFFFTPSPTCRFRIHIALRAKSVEKTDPTVVRLRE
jgi:hypothetical protein